MASKDHKLPKLTKAEEAFQQKMIAYFDERYLNVVIQLRAVCIALGLDPEKFWKAFVDDKAQEEFYVKLHVAQDTYNMEQQVKINEEKAKLEKMAVKE